MSEVTSEKLQEASNALDEALEALDGFVTGVYDAMLNEEHELLGELTFNIQKAKAILSNSGGAGGVVIDIFAEE